MKLYLLLVCVVLCALQVSARFPVDLSAATSTAAAPINAAASPPIAATPTTRVPAPTNELDYAAYQKLQRDHAAEVERLQQQHVQQLQYAHNVGFNNGQQSAIYAIQQLQSINPPNPNPAVPVIGTPVLSTQLPLLVPPTAGSMPTAPTTVAPPTNMVQTAAFVPATNTAAVQPAATAPQAAPTSTHHASVSFYTPQFGPFGPLGPIHPFGPIKPFGPLGPFGPFGPLHQH